MSIKTEKWLGHEIRFVEQAPGDWWAVAADVAGALSYKHTPHMLRVLDPEQKDVRIVDTLGGQQEMVVISELGVYAVIMRSRRKEAVQFQAWVYTVLRELRRSAGLESFQVFRTLDKQHQREAMAKLSGLLRQPARIDFIKANTIADKAVSTRFGHPKMLRKHQMTPEMLVDRQPIIEDTVTLMGMVDRFGLAIKVSETIYGKYVQ